MHKRLLLITLCLMAAVTIPGLLLSTVSASTQEVLSPTAPIATWTPGPPPTKTSGPTATALVSAKSPQKASAGASLVLYVRFPETWPWAEVHWQELWTKVQWQDEKGAWHDVEGWQGELDDVTYNDDGKVAGKKVWWVAESDLGKGPFRWMIYFGEHGAQLAKSESFFLPDSNAVRQVDVLIGLP